MQSRGIYYGEMQIAAAGADEFETQVSLTSLQYGSSIVRSGRSAVYGGYSWRGRSKGVQVGFSRGRSRKAKRGKWFGSRLTVLLQRAAGIGDSIRNWDLT